MEHRIVINAQDGFDGKVPFPMHTLADILVAITRAPSKFAKDLICKQLSGQYMIDMYEKNYIMEVLDES